MKLLYYYSPVQIIRRWIDLKKLGLSFIDRDSAYELTLFLGRKLS